MQVCSEDPWRLMTAAVPRLRKGPRSPSLWEAACSVCPAWLETEGTGEGPGLETLARAVRRPRRSQLRRRARGIRDGHKRAPEACRRHRLPF